MAEEETGGIETGGIVVVDGVEGSGGVELEAKLFDAFDAFDVVDAFDAFDVVGIFDVFDGFDIFDLDDEVPALNRWGGLSAAVDGLLNRWDGLDDPRDVPAVDGLLSR